MQSTMEPPEEDYDSEDMEEWEIEIREREFAAKTVTRVYRDAGTPLCTLSFLFGLRQEESLKASKETYSYITVTLRLLLQLHYRYRTVTLPLQGDQEDLVLSTYLLLATYYLLRRSRRRRA